MPVSPAKALSVLAQLRRAVPLTSAKWAGSELPLQIRALTSGEIQECHAAAAARFEELRLKTDAFFAALYEEEVSIQVLFAACRSAADPALPFAPSAADIRDNTTPEDRNEMLELYAAHAARVDPSPEQLGPEMCLAIIEAVKKKDRTRLRGFGLSALVTWLTTTGDPLASSPSGSSESGPS